MNNINQDEWLEQMLRQELPPVEDAGFAGQVVKSLRRQRHIKYLSKAIVPTLIVLELILAAILVPVDSIVKGLHTEILIPVQNIIKDCPQIPGLGSMTNLYLLLFVAGALLLAGIWAALSEES